MFDKKKPAELDDKTFWGNYFAEAQARLMNYESQLRSEENSLKELQKNFWKALKEEKERNIMNFKKIIRFETAVINMAKQKAGIK